MKKIIKGVEVICYNWRKKKWVKAIILLRYRIKTIKCDIVDVIYDKRKSAAILSNVEWYKIWNVKLVKEEK